MIRNMVMKSLRLLMIGTPVLILLVLLGCGGGGGGGAELTSVTVSAAENLTTDGLAVRYQAIGQFDDGSTADISTRVTWSSSDQRIANVSNATGSRGVVTAAGAGQVEILATLSGVTGQAGFVATEGFANVQLHLHGHSNHNGSPQPASMQWHSAWAAERGVGVLWWTDHTAAFDMHGATVLDVTQGTLNPASLVIENVGNPGSVDHLQPDISGGLGQVSLDSGGLSMSLQNSTADWQFFDYHLQSSTGPLRAHLWDRPLGSGVLLNTDLQGSGTTSAYCAIETGLAWHYQQEHLQHRLEFRLGPAGQVVTASPPAVVTIGSGPGFDVSGAAALLTDGLDNNLTSITIRAAAAPGQTATCQFSQLQLSSLFPDPADQLDHIFSTAKAHQRTYGPTEHVGMEQGNTGLPHMNAYFPQDIFPPTLLRQPTDLMELQTWVDDVHLQGGLVSYNHMFGTSSGEDTLGSAATQNTRKQTLASQFLANRLYGADILETGYLARGGADLKTHLELWDILLANGLEVTGTGVTDTHGGPWIAAMGPNPFTTWIRTASASQPELLAALQGKQVIFGNPFVWTGLLDFRVAGAGPGETLSVGKTTATVDLRLAPWPDGLEVFLVQGLLNPAQDGSIQYLHRSLPVARGGSVSVPLEQPSFIRLEAYQRQAGVLVPAVFSNPLFVK